MRKILLPLLLSLFLILITSSCSKNENPKKFIDEKITVLERVHPLAFDLMICGVNSEPIFESVDFKAIDNNDNNHKLIIIKKFSGMQVISTNKNKIFKFSVIGKIAKSDNYLIDYSYTNNKKSITTERLKIKLTKRPFYFQGVPIIRYYLEHSNIGKKADSNADITKVHPYAIYKLVNGYSYSIGSVNEINYLELIKSDLVNDFLIWEGEDSYGTKSSNSVQACSYKILKSNKNIFVLLVKIATNSIVPDKPRFITKKVTMQLLTTTDNKIKTIRCLGWQIIKNPQKKL